MAEIGVDIERAAAFLRKGQLVAIPTETVYGLAGNALDVKSVSSIFETKNRPSFDPLILHVASLEQVSLFVSEFPEKLKCLAEAFWPGPLTVLLPRKASVPDLVTSGLDRVAVRVPKHPVPILSATSALRRQHMWPHSWGRRSLTFLMAALVP
jgi:L-threonylcarbamoyladenylate synthase